MSLGLLHNTEQFDLTNDVAYQSWRHQKLSSYPATATDLLVTINDLNFLSDIEIANIKNCLDKFNMVVYSLKNIRDVTATELCHFANQLGLNRIDGNLCSGVENVSTVKVVESGRNKGYIPYTNKPISWHTDGYYNPTDKTVRSFVLHCAQAAASGGDNNLIDPEIVYIVLRDENPDFISALMANDVMTIPENIENGVEIRGRQAGPVFSIDSMSGKLHMRYTARSRSIEWTQSLIVQQAIDAIKSLFDSKSGYIFKYKLTAGQGLLCNNVLHNRTAFDDIGSIGNRELLRARYYDRV